MTNKKRAEELIKKMFHNLKIKNEILLKNGIVFWKLHYF